MLVVSWHERDGHFIVPSTLDDLGSLSNLDYSTPNHQNNQESRSIIPEFHFSDLDSNVL